MLFQSCGKVVKVDKIPMKWSNFDLDLPEGIEVYMGINKDIPLKAWVAKVDLSQEDISVKVLSSNDKEELVDWLRSFPLLHYDKKLNFALVHAGIYPTWDLAEALTYSEEVTNKLKDDSEIDSFLRKLYGDNPLKWEPTLTGIERLRFITNSFTRMRYCHQNQSLDFREKKHPRHASPNLVPWFAAPFRRKTKVSVVFGHWSSLTLNDAHKRGHRVFPTDTGAVWKGALTALRIDDLKYFTTIPRSKKNFPANN